MGRSLRGIEAGCHECDWYSEARNAQGNAVRHMRAHEHRTWVVLTYEYDPLDARRGGHVEYGGGVEALPTTTEEAP